MKRNQAKMLNRQRLFFTNFLPLYSIKPICNNISEQNCPDKLIFNNLSRHNHSSPMNNTATSKVKPSSHFFTLVYRYQ